MFSGPAEFFEYLSEQMQKSKVKVFEGNASIYLGMHIVNIRGEVAYYGNIITGTNFFTGIKLHTNGYADIIRDIYCTRKRNARWRTFNYGMGNSHCDMYYGN